MPRDELRRPLKRLTLRDRLWRRRPPAPVAAAVALVAALAARRLRVARDSEAAARSLAESNAWQTELNLYASDTAAAWRNYQDGALAAMKQRLRGHVPVPGGSDPRGFEWYLLDRFSEGDQRSILTLPGRVEDAAFSADGQWVTVAGAGICTAASGSG